MNKATLSRRPIIFSLSLLLVLSAYGSLANALPAFEPRPELDGHQCRDLLGVLVVNISQRVQNDADSAVTRPVWAFDDFTRYIKIYKLPSGIDYCATVEYKNGVFVTTAGISPNGTDPSIAGGIVGALFGGYRATFSAAAMNPTPPYKTIGFIGTFDYACDVDPSCPGYVNLFEAYFPGYSSFVQPWWGWRYTSNENGSSWINGCTGPDPDCPGNSGDITD